MTKVKKTSADKLILAVKPREIFGKKLSQLRRQGQIPGNVFGQEFKSQAITVDFKDFIRVYRQAKETRIVYLQIDKNEVPILIQNLQKHPVSDNILHIDFRKVDLLKKIETAVPVKIIGKSEAVDQKGGVLLTQMNELKVEARPEDLPSQIDIDINVLKEINQEIKVGNLPKNEHYVINESSDKIIVSVVPHKEETVVPETTKVAPEIITEKPDEGVSEAAESEKTSKQETKPASEEKSKKPPLQKPSDLKTKKEQNK